MSPRNILMRLTYLITTSILVLITLPSCALGAGICALNVDVRDGLTNAPVELPVRVMEAAKEFTTMAETRLGIAAFCDLPFGEYDVVVGSDHCGQTELRGVRIGFRDEVTLKVSANGCPHKMFPPLLPRGGGYTPMVCGVLVRIRSGDGQPISNAVAKSANNVDQVSDEFGRIWYALAANDKRAISVAKPAYQEKKVGLAAAETSQ